MAHKTAQGTWRVRWRDEEGRHSECYPRKVDAMEKERQVREAAKARKLGIVQAPESTDMTFAEFAEDWLERYCKIEKAATQHREDKSVIEMYLNHAFGTTKLVELRKTSLIQLRDELNVKADGRNKRPLKPKSINNITALARKMLATAVEWELLPFNPFEAVKPLRLIDQPFDYWMPEERNRFLRFAKQHDPGFVRAVQLACFTGLRLGEVAGLTRGDVDFEHRLIVVRRTYSHKLKRDLMRTKSGRIEHIPLNERAFEALAESRLIESTAKFFEPAELNQAVRRLKGLCKEVGTKPIRFHDLRHTFASSLVMAAVPLYTVQKLMRHKNITMTQRYAHLAPGYLRDASEILCGPDLAPILGDKALSI